MPYWILNTRLEVWVPRHLETHDVSISKLLGAEATTINKDRHSAYPRTVFFSFFIIHNDTVFFCNKTKCKKISGKTELWVQSSRSLSPASPESRMLWLEYGLFGPAKSHIKIWSPLLEVRLHRVGGIWILGVRSGPSWTSWCHSHGSVSSYFWFLWKRVPKKSLVPPPLSLASSPAVWLLHRLAPPQLLPWLEAVWNLIRSKCRHHAFCTVCRTK